MSTLINPWEMGDEVQGASLPQFCEANYLLVKVAPPKGKTQDAGLVGTFIMTSYYDDKENEIKTVEATESPSGYQIKFPLGKRGLVATKYRGPKSFYKFKHPETGKWFQISNDKLTEQYAKQHLTQTYPDWVGLTEIEQTELISEYLWDMYMFGLSMDLNLPSQEGVTIQPKVGLQTRLYRVYTPAAEGEKYPDIKITKWEKGHSGLGSQFTELPAEIAESVYAEYQKRDEDKFDPTSWESDDEKDDVI